MRIGSESTSRARGRSGHTGNGSILSYSNLLLFRNNSLREVGKTYGACLPTAALLFVDDDFVDDRVKDMHQYTSTAQLVVSRLNEFDDIIRAKPFAHMGTCGLSRELIARPFSSLTRFWMGCRQEVPLASHFSVPFCI